ncbi:thiamine-phosphate synthase family protein [Chloroflexota bacterium]
MNDSEQAELVLSNLTRAVEMLHNCAEFALLVPEVRVNLAYALPKAQKSNEVAAVDGRITVVKGLPHASGLPGWGASDHMARLIIEVRKYDPTVNAGINFKCDADIIEVVKEYCSERGILSGWIDRTREPAEVTEHDRSSMPWKIKQLQANYGSIPRLFYEGDGWGKEPLFVAIGNDAVEVAGIAIEVARRYRQKVG